MTDHINICPACMTWHMPPIPCGHNCETPCVRCGNKRGYRFMASKTQVHEPADECWKCASKLQAAD